MGLTDFDNTTAVITGGASGIGLGLAHRLGREGANLVIADIEEAALERASRALTDAGYATEDIVADGPRHRCYMIDDQLDYIREL